MTRRGTRAVAAGLIGLAGCFDTHNVVRMPAPPKVTADYVAAAGRVEAVGRQVLDQNTFTGLNPVFHTVGRPELVLFHAGPGALVISDGLVAKCRTDAELAAVLCTELGRMQAEQQSARRVGRDDTPAPASARTDPRAAAEALMTGAGLDPADLDRVAPLVRDAEANDALRKQMAGTAAAPKWQK